jgi:hypothetical protein
VLTTPQKHLPGVFVFYRLSPSWSAIAVEFTMSVKRTAARIRLEEDDCIGPSLCASVGHVKPT